VKHLRFLQGLGRHIDLVNRGRHPIYLDYAVRARPRYGWGHPPHAALHDLIADRRDAYRDVLSGLEAAAESLRRIPLAGSDVGEPRWVNGYMPGLDAATLYAFPKLFGSARYLEVGSGHSTRFVRRAIDDERLPTRITSIDPSPRTGIDHLCHEVIRGGLEDVPLEVFDTLGENDILMVDGSHRCFQNSDVTVAFLDVLPRLAPGVLVFIHDVFLPSDYPAAYRTAYYSEQYLLAVLLGADAGRRYEIVFPAHFCTVDPELAPVTLATWRRIAPAGVPPEASGFWLRVKS
jgi:hypothetical protein